MKNAATRLGITLNMAAGNVIFAGAMGKTISNSINFARTATNTDEG